MGYLTKEEITEAIREDGVDSFKERVFVNAQNQALCGADQCTTPNSCAKRMRAVMKDFR